MAIDPMLYEKISGRSADPSKRLGSVLAENEKRQRRSDGSDLGSQIVSNHFKAKWIVSVVGSIIVLIVLVVSLLTRGSI